MNEKLFNKKRNKQNKQQKVLPEKNSLYNPDEYDIEYNLDHDFLSQDIPSLFSDEDFQNHEIEEDDEQDRTIVPDQSNHYVSEKQITTKRKKNSIEVNKNKKHKTTKPSNQEKIQDQINNKENNIENDNDLSATLLNINQEDTEKEEEDEIEIEEDTQNNIYANKTVINNNQELLDDNNENITLMNQSNYSYREYNDTYVLYDSDEEEDRSMMEIILASDTYEKIKNYLSCYHMEDIINAIEKNEQKKQYNDHNSNQFHIVYLIDIYHISNYDMKIGNDIIQGFKNNIKMHFECATLSLLESHLFRNNINIWNLKKKLNLNIRFKNIPSTDISIISNLQNTISKFFFHGLSIIHENNFYNIKGIITALYLPEYYVKYHTFICDNSSCKCYKKKKMLHQHYSYNYTSSGIELEPNLVDKRFIENNMCTYCKCPRKEIVEERIGSLIQKGMLSVLEKNGCYFNTCTIFIEGEDLVNSAFVGDIINIIGILERQHNSIRRVSPKLFYNDFYIRVNNMWSCSYISTLKTNKELLEKHVNQSYIPKSISFLLQLNLSPFAFTQRLVDYFCEEIVPAAMWRKTKLMILLSLVSTPSDPKLSFRYLIEWEKNSFQSINEKLHLMFVVDDFHPLFLRLIESSQKMRRNHNLILEEKNKYKPLLEISTTTDKNLKCPSYIDGGNICYAKDGILKVPFSNLTSKEVRHIISVMENQVIVPLQGSQIECFVPFVNTTIIWGLYDIQFLNINKKKGKKNQIKYIKDTILNDNDIMEQNQDFDNLIGNDLVETMCEIEKTEENDSEETNENLLIPDIIRDDFIYYINTVSNIDVKISDECIKLIKDYCHVYRSKIKLTVELSSVVYIFQKLINITKCHSRLCFRNVAIIDDALIAIMIYEESIAVVEKSSSLLAFNSLPNDFENFTSYGSLTLPERVSCYQQRKKDLSQFNKIVKNDDDVIEKIYDKIINLITNKN